MYVKNILIIQGIKAQRVPKNYYLKIEVLSPRKQFYATSFKGSDNPRKIFLKKSSNKTQMTLYKESLKTILEKIEVLSPRKYY